MRYALLALLLVGCSKRSEATPSPSKAAPAPTVEAIPPRPKDLVVRKAFATFEKNELSECVDVLLVVPAGKDAGADPLAKFTLPKSKATPIPKACDEQFPDRKELGTCTLTFKDAPGLKIDANYFRFEDVGLSDARMAECLKDGGEWDGLKKDSPEWRKAKLDHSRKGLHKAVEKLQRAADDVE